MKMYNKWKGMNKKAKICLAGTAIYTAATLALPAYATISAREEYQSKEEVQIARLADIKTTAEADSIFNQKLAEYSSDQ
ncbi:MAG: hypothetical protein L6408_07655, partial [Nanoarchaeota archaeon]|nr:hypothetical protein [Nanoarchaeota archaeon]